MSDERLAAVEKAIEELEAKIDIDKAVYDEAIQLLRDSQEYVGKHWRERVMKLLRKLS